MELLDLTSVSYLKSMIKVPIELQKVLICRMFLRSTFRVIFLDLHCLHTLLPICWVELFSSAEDCFSWTISIYLS